MRVFVWRERRRWRCLNRGVLSRGGVGFGEGGGWN